MNELPRPQGSPTTARSRLTTSNSPRSTGKEDLELDTGAMGDAVEQEPLNEQPLEEIEVESDESDPLGVEASETESDGEIVAAEEEDVISISMNFKSDCLIKVLRLTIFRLLFPLQLPMLQLA